MARQTIGRAEDCDYRINDLSVSRTHAEIEKLASNRYLLRDLDSTYGTRVFREGDWVEILEIEVKKDTPIRFGDHETTIANLVGGVMDDQVATDAAAGPRDNPPDPPPNEAQDELAPVPEERASEEQAPVGAPAPEAAAAPTPPPKAPKKAARTGGGSRRTLWLVLGGVGFFLIVVAVTAAVLFFSDNGLSDAETRAELLATCQARGGAPEQCACIADFVMARADRQERDVLLFNWQNQNDPDRVSIYLRENYTMEERMRLRGRMMQLILGAEAQCRTE